MNTKDGQKLDDLKLSIAETEHVSLGEKESQSLFLIRAKRSEELGHSGI